VPGVQSPTVRRRRLGQELRQLREAARLTIDEVAERLEVSPAKISRIETGRVSVRPRDVSDLLDQYEIQGTLRDNLLSLAREARQQGWWHSYNDVLSEGTDTFVGLEAEAEAIRLYEVQFVPGLLQTSEYARAVLRAHYRSKPPEQIERRVELRMARQRLVIEQNNTRIWAVLDGYRRLQQRSRGICDNAATPFRSSSGRERVSRGGSVFRAIGRSDRTRHVFDRIRATAKARKNP
jgi:transcriptional regulator with XRE-family HTH domain